MCMYVCLCVFLCLYVDLFVHPCLLVCQSTLCFTQNLPNSLSHSIFFHLHSDIFSNPTDPILAWLLYIPFRLLSPWLFLSSFTSTPLLSPPLLLFSHLHSLPPFTSTLSLFCHLHSSSFTSTLPTSSWSANIIHHLHSSSFTSTTLLHPSNFILVC